MNFLADKLALLLSSDWFLDGWQFCALRSSRPVRVAAQVQCRGIVEDLIRGSDGYWDIEFSEQRGAETERAFERALATAAVDSNDVALFRGFLDSDVDHQTDQELLTMLCQLLVSQYKQDSTQLTGFGSATIDVVERALSEFDPEASLVRLARTATSKWDIWLENLTPGVFVTLDTARDLARYSGPQRLFLHNLRSRLTHDDFELLRNWLVTTSISLTGREISI